MKKEYFFEVPQDKLPEPLFQCDVCGEVYKTYSEAYDCHLNASQLKEL